MESSIDFEKSIHETKAKIEDILVNAHKKYVAGSSVSDRMDVYDFIKYSGMTSEEEVIMEHFIEARNYLVGLEYLYHDVPSKDAYEDYKKLLHTLDLKESMNG